MHRQPEEYLKFSKPTDETIVREPAPPTAADKDLFYPDKGLIMTTTQVLLSQFKDFLVT